MNQNSLTNSTVLKSRNDELVLKLCWDTWVFGSITTTKINAIAATTTTTTTIAAAAATFATSDNAAAVDNSNAVNYAMAVTNTISATTTTTTTTNITTTTKNNKIIVWMFLRCFQFPLLLLVSLFLYYTCTEFLL